MEPAPTRPPLSENACRRLSALALMDRLVHAPDAFHVALLEGDDAFLEPIFDFMLAEDLVAIGADDHYRPTPLGRQAYQRLLHQQQSYLAHFDIYAGVDLAAGVFAEPEEDYLDDPRWADLRVAVAEYKGIDPYRLVFLSMLAGGAFFENPGWKFDLALGSSFFSELQEIVRSQIAMEDLGYEDEDGTVVTGEEVLVDVILQGARINAERLAEERGRQPGLLEELEPEDGDASPDGEGELAAAYTVALVPYDPWGPASAYASSATFVEPLWHDPYW